jgi:hypothetical protein
LDLVFAPGSLPAVDDNRPHIPWPETDRYLTDRLVADRVVADRLATDCA